MMHPEINSLPRFWRITRAPPLLWNPKSEEYSWLLKALRGRDLD
jgi:hypothetical protein